MLNFLKGRTRKGSLKELLVQLHHDEQGAEGIELLLIVCAIALPLLGVLIIFRDQITEWLSAKWGDIAGRSEEPVPDLPLPGI